MVEALRGLRGVEAISAVTFVAGIGDLSRFDSPSQLMAYLGLVPSERSSGDHVRRGGVTKTGNGEARRMLVEAAWSYRYPPRVAQEKVEVLVKLPKSVRDIAWKAQMRHRARTGRLYLGDRTRGSAGRPLTGAAPRRSAEGGMEIRVILESPMGRRKADARA